MATLSVSPVIWFVTEISTFTPGSIRMDPLWAAAYRAN